MQRPRRRRGHHPRAEHVRGAHAGLAHVDVRIGAVRGHRARVPSMRAVTLACRSSAGDDRHRGADDRADAREQLALGIVGAFGDRGAVQVEEDRVEAAALQVFDDLAADALERVRVTRFDGIAPAQADGRSVQPGSRRLADEAAERLRGRRHLREHRAPRAYAG